MTLSFTQSKGMTDAAGATAIEPALVSIPGGWFLMGSDSGQDCECPVHRVWVDSFFLAATQVTNEEYERFLRATSALPPPFWQDANFNHPRQPVAGVSWHEATRYCEWVTSRTGRARRLPTEAEWERAARGGLEQRQFPWGDDLRNRCLTTRRAGRPALSRSLAMPRTLSVFTTSAITCMSGEAYWYDPNYYSVSPERNPGGPERSSMKPGRKSSRGGSWRHHIKVARCSARSSIPPEFQYADYGFRVACD